MIKYIPLATQVTIQEEIKAALNECAGGVSNEFFRAVQLEMADELDPEFQRANPLSSRPQTDPDMLAIWRPGHLRLFITHRDGHKRQAHELATALQEYGISAFLAHDTIGALEDWQSEILKGLETMEVMLAFVTDDFHESTFCNQEIGYALGRQVPIIALKLQKADPPGFISSYQALKGALDRPADSAPKICDLLVDKLGQRARLQPLLIHAFANSWSYKEAEIRFNRMEPYVVKLSEDEERMIVKAFNGREDLKGCYYLNRDRIVSFMNRVTDRQYRLVHRDLTTEPATRPIQSD